MTEHDRGRARRAEVLDAIRDAPSGLGIAEIADRIGAHPNTVRFHLDLLVEDGVVGQSVEPPTGPGRPRVVYHARPVMALGSDRRYRLLAEILLGRLTAGTSDGAREAVELGRAWGARLAEAGEPVAGPREAVDRLLAMLDDLGFAPEAQTSGRRVSSAIRLRHCPFHELAERHREVVCPLHLGLMRGALEGMQATVGVSDLVPFAEPHACIAHLIPA